MINHVKFYTVDRTGNQLTFRSYGTENLVIQKVYVILVRSINSKLN